MALAIPATVVWSQRDNHHSTKFGLMWIAMSIVMYMKLISYICSNRDLRRAWAIRKAVDKISGRESKARLVYCTETLHSVVPFCRIERKKSACVCCKQMPLSGVSVACLMSCCSWQLTNCGNPPFCLHYPRLGAPPPIPGADDPHLRGGILGGTTRSLCRHAQRRNGRGE